MSEILSIVNIDPMETVRVLVVLAFLAGVYSCWVMQLYTKPTPEVEPDMPEVIYELIDTLDPKRVRWEWVKDDSDGSYYLSVACNETFKELGCYNPDGAAVEPFEDSLPVEELQRYRFVPKAKEAPLEVAGPWLGVVSNSGTVTAKGVAENRYTESDVRADMGRVLRYASSTSPIVRDAATQLFVDSVAAYTREPGAPETPSERDPVDIVKSRDEFGPEGEYRLMQTRYSRNTATLMVFRGEWFKDRIGTVFVDLPARTLELWGSNYATIAKDLPLDDPRSFGSLIEEYNDTL